MITIESAIDAVTQSAQQRHQTRFNAPELLRIDDPIIMGRILFEDITAQVNQPGADVSAMDGYAVRHADLKSGAVLRQIGEAPAGHPFPGKIGTSECVRVFTGSVIPDGADHVVIQEDVRLENDKITLLELDLETRHIRPKGNDFRYGKKVLPSGHRLDGHAMNVLASCGAGPMVDLARQPVIGLIANGDELRLPGENMNPGDVMCSTPFGVAGLLDSWGASSRFAGIAGDSINSIQSHLDSAMDCDVIVTLGGASVGDHDHMKRAFLERGLKTEFEKIAVKPGKPSWFGRLDSGPLVLGLPGNPASALVCAHLLLKPIVYALLGRPVPHIWRTAELADPLGSNGGRSNFLRASLFTQDNSPTLYVRPSNRQDSALQTPFIDANALILREPHARDLEQGALVSCLMMTDG